MLTLIFGISKRPLTSREPCGNGRPPGLVHLTRARTGLSSRHWKTTSRPSNYNSGTQLDIIGRLPFEDQSFMHMKVEIDHDDLNF